MWLYKGEESVGMFDRIAPVYDTFSDLFLPNLKKHVFDRTELKENDRVLDVGGGTGRLMDDLSEIEAGAYGYVVDRSKSMVCEAGPNIDIILGDASELPFDSDIFDLVLCIDAFHHFERKKKSLDEMVRVVGTGGEVLILELVAGHPLTRIVEHGERLLGEPSRFYEKEKLADVFLGNGFEVDIENINSSQYILHAKR